MLDAEAKEAMRQAAEGCSAELSDARRDATTTAAHAILKTVREAFDSADDAAQAAYMMASTFAALRHVEVLNLDEMLSGSRDTYALVAGALAGVYMLPPLKDEPEGEGVTVLAPEMEPDESGETPTPGTGMYL